MPSKKKPPFGESVNQRKITAFFKTQDPSQAKPPPSNKIQTRLARFFPRKVKSENEEGGAVPSGGSFLVMDEDIIILSSDSENEAEKDKNEVKKGINAPAVRKSRGKSKKGGTRAAKKKLNGVTLSDTDEEDLTDETEELQLMLSPPKTRKTKTMMLSSAASPSLTPRTPTKISPKPKASYFSPVRHVKNSSRSRSSSSTRSPIKSSPAPKKSFSTPSASASSLPISKVPGSQMKTVPSVVLFSPMKTLPSQAPGSPVKALPSQVPSSPIKTLPSQVSVSPMKTLPTQVLFAAKKSVPSPAANMEMTVSNSQSPVKKLNWSPGGDPYYLENFRMILNSVVDDEHHTHLLNEEDRAFIKDFHELSRPSQCLYVRLFQRKLQWKPASSINYPKIADNLIPGFEELYRKTFLIEIKDHISDIDLDSLLNLLSGEQITILAKKLSLSPKVKTKEGCKSAITGMVKSQRTLSGSPVDIVSKAALQLLGPTYKVSEHSRNLFSRVFILWSPPQYWDDEDQGSNQLLTVLLTNSGRMEYPEYSITKSTQIYPCRFDLTRFHEAWNLHSDIQGQLESKLWDEAKKIGDVALTTLRTIILKDKAIEAQDKSLPSFLRAYTAGSVLTRTVWLGVEAYQKTKDFSKSNETIAFLLSQSDYLSHYRGRWHDRLIINAKHLKQSNREIRALIKAALDDEFLQDSWRLGLSIRLERFKTDEPTKAKSTIRPKGKKRKSQPIETSDEEDENDIDPEAYNADHFLTILLQHSVPERTIEGEKMCIASERAYGKSVFIGGGSSSSVTGNSVSSVELFAMNYYKEQGYTKGLHGEGMVPIALYGLIFWDIIYDDKIQDVFQSPFQPFPLDIHFEDFYNQRQGLIESMLLNLRFKWSLSDAFEVLQRNWDKNFEKISIVNWSVFDSADSAKDLVKSMGLQMLAGICERLATNFRYFRSGFPDLVVWDGKDCLFAEVKGPGDSLSSKQSLWLDFLISIGAKAEICHVKSVSNKRIRLD